MQSWHCADPVSGLQWPLGGAGHPGLTSRSGEAVPRKGQGRKARKWGLSGALYSPGMRPYKPPGSWAEKRDRNRQVGTAGFRAEVWRPESLLLCVGSLRQVWDSRGPAHSQAVWVGGSRRAALVGCTLRLW